MRSDSSHNDENVRTVRKKGFLGPGVVQAKTGKKECSCHVYIMARRPVCVEKRMCARKNGKREKDRRSEPAVCNRSCQVPANSLFL